MSSSTSSNTSVKYIGLITLIAGLLMVVAGGVTWGFLCLHREGPTGFSADETQFVKRIAPHLAEGIRLGLLIGSLQLEQAADAPGLVLLTEDGSLLTANPADLLDDPEINVIV